MAYNNSYNILGELFNFYVIYNIRAEMFLYRDPEQLRPLNYINSDTSRSVFAIHEIDAIITTSQSQPGVVYESLLGFMQFRGISNFVAVKIASRVDDIIIQLNWDDVIRMDGSE